jgi:hypothetical protein
MIDGYPVCPTCRRSSCHEHATELRDPIALYYDDCRARSDAAWEKFHAAKASGADSWELHRLREAAIDAGDTGD